MDEYYNSEDSWVDHYEQVSVIRCKDCEHYRPYLTQFTNTPRGDGYCKLFHLTTEGEVNINCYDDWYCAWGRKKEDKE